MTKREALENAVIQWDWMGRTAQEEKRLVRKIEYFEKEFKFSTEKGVKVPLCECFLCEYNDSISAVNCKNCPSEHWAKNSTKDNFPCSPCYNMDSPYRMWVHAKNWQEQSTAAFKMVEFLKNEIEKLQE